MPSAEAGLEDAPVIATEQLCRLVGCEFGAEHGGKLRQVGIARQRAGADQAKLVGAQTDMVDAHHLGHLGKAFGEAMIELRRSGARN